MTTRGSELLTEIEMMNDREDSVDLSIQHTQSQLKACYWSNLNREQKGTIFNVFSCINIYSYLYIFSCLYIAYHCFPINPITHRCNC